MTTSPLLELRHLSYTYPGSTAPILQDLNLQISTQRLGLIGPNGCGKTTLFQIMVGLAKPSSGELLLAGQPIRSAKDLQALRREVGLLFQSSDDQLFSPTVIEDVAFGPLNLGLSASEAREIAAQTLADLGLAGFEERLTHRLSGGEKKLVALATILAMRPRLLLLDEPTNNLDPATRERLITILCRLKQAHIIISHDWDFLEQTTEAVYTLEHGHLHRCAEARLHTHPHIHPYGDQPHNHQGKRPPS